MCLQEEHSWGREQQEGARSPVWLEPRGGGDEGEAMRVEGRGIPWAVGMEDEGRKGKVGLSVKSCQPW